MRIVLLLFFFFSYGKETRKEAKEKEKIKFKMDAVYAYFGALSKFALKGRANLIWL